MTEHKELNTVIPFRALSVKTTDRGTVEFTAEVEPEKAPMAVVLMGNGQWMAAAGLKDYSPYSAQAKKLHINGFFMAPPVWRALGTDANYQDWARNQPCVVSGRNDWFYEKGEERCEFSHVRRSSDSGTGIKPMFMGVPMCRAVHDHQHSQGYLSMFKTHAKNRIKNNANTADEVLDWLYHQGLKHVSRWAKVQLKSKLGVESLASTPPRLVREWAIDNDLVQFLPHEYRER